MNGMIRDTIVEMKERKLFWLFIIVTGLAVLAIVGLKGWVEQMRMQEAPPEVQQAFGTMANQILVGWTSGFLSILVFFSVLGTAGLIPSMLSRGRAEFYMSKPISRSRLLLGKLFSVWSVYGGLVAVAGVLVMGLIAALYGIFQARVFFIVLEALIALFVWLSITGFVGTVSGSFALAVTTTFALWLAQYGLHLREYLVRLVDNKFVEIALDICYYILPKHSENGDLFVALAVGRPVPDWLPLWSSLLFAVAMYGLSVWAFRRKDY
ncbi:MAG: ABC transporter permease subunit [candidate division Zixibacteria bacterium]|jgi:ABC-type transport system involved in multi-copper enzyme maturation permease subunit|nr:ABC transporter permease subunit [candidate division Zixibacteria bacterium]